MKKFKLIYDKNIEIPWLNQMAANGWNLKRFSYGMYTFEPCKPGEFVYETDLKDKMFTLSEEYQQILEAQNMEIVDGASGGLWFLVRRKKELGPLVLYTDTHSRLEQYFRIRRLFSAVFIIESLGILIELWLFTRTQQGDMLGVACLLFALFIAAIAMSMLFTLQRVNREIAGMENEPDRRSPLLWCLTGVLAECCGFILHTGGPQYDWPFRLLATAGFILVATAVFFLIRTGKNRVEENHCDQ